MIHVSTEGGHFSLEKVDFFLFLLPFRISSSMNDFNFMEKTNYFFDGIFPLPKTSGVGANRKHCTGSGMER